MYDVTMCKHHGPVIKQLKSSDTNATGVFTGFIKLHKYMNTVRFGNISDTVHVISLRIIFIIIPQPCAQTTIIRTTLSVHLYVCFLSEKY